MIQSKQKHNLNSRYGKQNLRNACFLYVIMYFWIIIVPQLTCQKHEPEPKIEFIENYATS